jgi:flagellar hook-length control protein FliK
MTNGMISTTVSAGSAALANVSAAPGKTAASNGFEGALVQALGGTGGNGTSASGARMPAGLLGLMGQLGVQSTDPMSQELLQLLTGLSRQLEGLDPNAELPADVQNQLASLLLLFQNLLTQMGFQPNADQNEGAAFGTAQSDSSVPLTPSALASNDMPVVQNLQQTLKPLSAMLSNGTTPAAAQALLTQQIQQTINALTAQSSSGQLSLAPPVEVNAASNAFQDAVKLSEQGTTATQAGSEQMAATAPEIRRAGAALRNPVWQLQTTNAAEPASLESTATPKAIEPSDASGQNGSAPAWTFLKGDNVSLTAAASTNSPAAPTQVPVQQFAEQMGKYLVKQFVLTQGNGTHEAKILLHPEHLGQVDIRIMIQNGQLTAHFVTENGAARDLLENQLSQLRTALQGQGLQVDRMDVVQQSSTSASASFFQQNGRQPGSGHSGNSGNGRGNRGVYDDSAGFEAELDRTTFLREVGYGSALNVKA